MRCRLARLLLCAISLVIAAAPFAYAAPVSLAQVESEEGTEVENEGGSQADPGTDTDQGEGGGQSDDFQGGEGDPDAETGAGEGEQAEAVEEEGPQWTYQMSKIVLVMLLMLFLAMGGLYYKMIASRQRRGF